MDAFILLSNQNQFYLLQNTLIDLLLLHCIINFDFLLYHPLQQHLLQ